MALSAAAVSAGDRSRVRRGRRRFDADETHVVRDDVVQLPRDRQPLFEQRGGRPACPVASAAGRPEHDRTDADTEAGRREEGVRAATALQDRAQEDDDPERRRHEDVDGVRVTIGQGPAPRVGHGSQA